MDFLGYLAAQQVAFETIHHPPAFSAQKRAKYLHVPGKRVAKSVLLRSPHGFLLAVLPASRHIDTDRLAEALDGPVRLASDDEIADVFLDCARGVVPPFGLRYGLGTILDDSIDPEDWIIFESNTNVEAIRMRCRDFERLELPRRLRFGR
jgi:Ala-tRNA(Pro) deacylase